MGWRFFNRRRGQETNCFRWLSGPKMIRFSCSSSFSTRAWTRFSVRRKMESKKASGSRRLSQSCRQIRTSNSFLRFLSTSGLHSLRTRSMKSIWLNRLLGNWSTSSPRTIQAYSYSTTYWAKNLKMRRKACMISLMIGSRTTLRERPLMANW